MKKILLSICALAMTAFSVGAANAQTTTKAGLPDLAVGGVYLAEPGCDINETTVRALVYNYGTVAVEGFKIQYITSYGDTVTKELADSTISAAVTSTVPGILYYDFPEKITLTPNVTCKVKVNVSLLDGGNEMSQTNNSGSASTIGFSTASVPSEFTASASELFSNSGLWFYDAASESMQQNTKDKLAQAQPLYTRCINLEPGNYRVSFVYATGEVRQDATGEVTSIWMDPFEILVGKSGTVISDWTQIHEEDSSCTSKYFMEKACSFDLSEGGSYQFAVNMLKGGEPSGSGGYMYQWGWNICIKSIKIEKLEDHKVVAYGITSTLPHSIPADLSGVEYNFLSTVKNVGKNKEKAFVSYALASNPQTVIGRSDTIEIESEASVVTSATLHIPAAVVGYKDSVVATVQMMDQTNAATEEEKEMRYAYNVTDSVYTYDVVTPERFAIGDYIFAGNITSSIEFGVPYTLAKADTLTSITIGMAASVDVVPLKISIYQWDAQESKVGGVVYSTEFVRSPEAQMYLLQLDNPRLLVPGSYMLAVEQKSSKVNAAIMYDGEDNGESWVLSAAAGPKKQTNFGYMVGRLNFGHSTADILEKDVMVASIDKPTGDGRFSETEEVSATIRNVGMADVSFKVYCKVDDKEESQEVSLLAYESKSVSFKMNLFADGLHRITFRTELEGDENTVNDTMSKEVKSLGAPDPYVMDFEFVEDFEYQNLTPWTSRDVDTMPTVGLDGFDVPYKTEKMAFMALNPSLIANWSRFFPGYQGQRYGYCPSSAVDTVPNNDWLISARLRLPETGSKVTFAVMSGNDAVQEEYNVLVSTTNNLLTSFQKVGETRKTGTGKDFWTEVSVDLSEYNGKAVYVAIQCVSHNSSSNGFTAFFIDDIEVSKASANEQVSNLDGYFHLYPNPASERVFITSSGLDMQRIEVYNMAGLCVYNSGNRSGDSAILSLNGWASGIYVARITTASGVQTLKFVVR